MSILNLLRGSSRSDQTSQFTRLHNIDVWGVPGVVNSVENTTKNDILNIYPVPAQDFIVIKLAEEAVNSELQIIDAAGKTINRRVVDQQTSSIDIGNLNSGIYFIQITHNGEKYGKQFMVK